jgi:hypothetical protein
MAAHIPVKSYSLLFFPKKDIKETKHVSLNLGQVLAPGEWWSLTEGHFGFPL